MRSVISLASKIVDCKNRSWLQVTCLFITLVSLPSHADTNFKPSINAELGQSYVNGILLPELDTYVEGQDQATFWRLDGSLASELSTKSSLDVGLSYLSESYQTNSDYDLSLLSYYADYQYEWNALSVGAQSQASEVDLGGRAFMQQRNINTYASYALNPQYLVFGSIALDTKKLADFTERNSRAWHTDLQLFVFPQAGHSVYLFGLGLISEQAEDETFDNRQWRFHSGYRRYGQWLGKGSQVDLGLRYDEREYAKYWQQNQQRQDQHRQLYLEFLWAFTPHVSPKMALLHDKYQSTLAEFSFSESTIQLSVQFSL